MMPVLLLGLGLALLLGKKSSAKAKAPIANEAERIIREAQDIANGKRDDFSTEPSVKTQADAIARQQSQAARDAWAAPAPKPKAPLKGPIIEVTSPKIRESTDAEREAARRAAQTAKAAELARAKEASTPRPAPKPAAQPATTKAPTTAARQATALARSPAQAARDLAAYAKKVLAARQGSLLGVRGKPSPTVAAAQRDMGSIPADGMYGPQTRARGAALGVAMPVRK